MSFFFQKFEPSPLFSKANNDFLNEWFAWIVPSEKLISELPAQLKTQSVKPFLFQKDTCKFLEKLLNFDVCSDDVYVISIPKSGSSETDGRDEVMGDFDMLTNIDKSKRMAQETHVTKSLSETEATKMAWIDIFTCLKSPRVIKSHHPPYFLPKEIWSKGARVIYIVRNPKDTAASYYHFMRNYFLADITLDDVVHGFINDLSNTSPHLDHIQNYWKLRHLPNVFFVHYEDLVNDSIRTLKKMSEFLGQNYSDEQLKELSEYISIKNMKHNKAINRADELNAMETMMGKKRPDADFK